MLLIRISGPVLNEPLSPGSVQSLVAGAGAGTALGLAATQVSANPKNVRLILGIVSICDRTLKDRFVTTYSWSPSDKSFAFFDDGISFHEIR